MAGWKHGGSDGETERVLLDGFRTLVCRETGDSIASTDSAIVSSMRPTGFLPPITSP
jgi:hypothetical protein